MPDVENNFYSPKFTAPGTGNLRKVLDNDKIVI